MTYSVKEIFYTLQGEGANAGRPAVFVRFAGCNLWTGREKDRTKATCSFCDTDFVGGKHMTAHQIVDRAVGFFPDLKNRFVVITGGEPALQFDNKLLSDLREAHFYTAIETNGTVALRANPDWITVSPKTHSLKIAGGNELKFIYPQNTLDPELFGNLPFDRFYLQPKWERWHWRRKRNLRATINYCMQHPQWRLSLQSHKTIGIP